MKCEECVSDLKTISRSNYNVFYCSSCHKYSIYHESKRLTLFSDELIEDLSIFHDENVLVGMIVSIIKDCASEQYPDIEINDKYLAECLYWIKLNMG